MRHGSAEAQYTQTKHGDKAVYTMVGCTATVDVQPIHPSTTSTGTGSRSVVSTADNGASTGKADAMGNAGTVDTDTCTGREMDCNAEAATFLFNRVEHTQKKVEYYGSYLNLGRPSGRNAGRTKDGRHARRRHQNGRK
jgi:hypothetical protein